MNDALQSRLDEIASLASCATTQPTETPIPGVLLIQGDVPQHQLAAIYEPMIGFVVQGGKHLTVGDTSIRMTAPSYFVVPTELPATGRVVQGREGAPYLSVALRINQDSVLELLKQVPESVVRRNAVEGFCACAVGIEFVDAWVRMLRLLKHPDDIAALAPAYEREILYRVLIGPQGWRVRQAIFGEGKAPGVQRAVRWIRENYARAIDVEPIARRVGMGVTTFHRGFKQVTGLSPIQFQKQLRLLEARKLMRFGGRSVSESAFEVGYESVSQFSREYARHFGSPPTRDVAALRELRSVK